MYQLGGTEAGVITGGNETQMQCNVLRCSASEMGDYLTLSERLDHLYIIKKIIMKNLKNMKKNSLKYLLTIIRPCKENC